VRKMRSALKESEEGFRSNIDWYLLNSYPIAGARVGFIPRYCSLGIDIQKRLILR
jgi:hypothetical protein